MLKFWGRISSINVRKVVFAAQLLELPFERIDAGATFGITRFGNGLRSILRESSAQFSRARRSESRCLTVFGLSFCLSRWVR